MGKPLPAAVERLFQEYKPGQLSWPESRTTVTQRVLKRGDLDAISWLRSHMSDEELRTFIREREGRGLTSRDLRFWGLILEIPDDEIDQWVDTARKSVWHKRSQEPDGS